MTKQKKFLLFAIAVGAMGVIIGGVTIWSLANELLQP